MNWKWCPQWTVTSGMLTDALRKPSHFGDHAKWCCTVAVEVAQGLQLVLSIWSGSRLLQPIAFCSLFKPSLRGWRLTDDKIESSAQELPPPHNPNNANILLAPVCPASGFLRQFLRLSFQNPACLSSLARSISSSGLDALCCTQKMPHRWTLSPTH